MGIFALSPRWIKPTTNYSEVFHQEKALKFRISPENKANQRIITVCFSPREGS
jgi:hypothetical protein